MGHRFSGVPRSNHKDMREGNDTMVPHDVDGSGHWRGSDLPVGWRPTPRNILDSCGDSNGVRDLLTERSSTHGDPARQLIDAQKIKTTLRECGHWDALHPIMKECLESIALKISRILNGNPNTRDHWLDIAGYAQLVVDQAIDKWTPPQ